MILNNTNKYSKNIVKNIAKYNRNLMKSIKSLMFRIKYPDITFPLKSNKIIPILTNN